MKTKLFAIVVLIISYFFLYKIFIPRVSAFGCFDDCFNFMGGYFLLNNKKLFSEIFYNHAPLMAYLSMLIQAATHPHNLYELILRHRQFLLLFSFLSELLLIFRFGIRIVPFVLLYEFTKFYLFGDRFLAEGFIVYPLSYVFGVFYEQVTTKKRLLSDVIFASVCTWFVVFMREPYALTALLLFLFILIFVKNKERVLSVAIFIILSSITVFVHNVFDFIYNIITINATSVVAENNQTHIFGITFLKSFFYPFVILFQNNWSFFGKIEASFAVVFITLSLFLLWKKNYFLILVTWVILGTANLRFVSPGDSFYGAFHLLPWYALSLLAICFFLWRVKDMSRKLFIFLLIILTITFLSIFTKGSYIHDKPNQQVEFINNYGIPMQVGNVVNALSNPSDALFLDGSDDIIYFVAKRYSQYKYSWYTSIMPGFPPYQQARLAMFKNNPPDFYYGTCPGQTISYYIAPSWFLDQYVRLYNINKPSCLWVKKSKIASISNTQWQKAGEQLYFLNPHQ